MKKTISLLLCLCMIFATAFSAQAAPGKPHGPQSTIEFKFDDDEEILLGKAIFTAANRSDICELEVIRKLDEPAYTELTRYPADNDKNMFHTYLTADGTSFEESCFPYVEKWETTTDKESGETVHTGICTRCGETVEVTCLECLQKLPAFKRDAAKIDDKNDMKEPCPICGKDVMLIDEDNLEIVKSEAVPANCKEYGYVLYTFPGCNVSYKAEDRTVDLTTLHTWTDPVFTEATCVKPSKYTKTCTFCGKEVVTYEGKPDTTKHNVEEWTSHTFNDKSEHEQTCTHYGICTLCNQEVSEENAFVIQTEKATCTKGESVSYICSGCGYAEIQGEIGHALGHEYENTVHNWPDATHTGICTRCGQTFTFNVDVVKSANPDYNKKKPCEAAEFIYSCKSCGETWQEEVTGHQLGEFEVTKEATCKETGIKTAECSVCGKKVNEDIPLADHDFSGTLIVDTPATCEEDGSGHKECTVCGERKTEVIPAFGHNYKDGICIICKQADPNKSNKTDNDDDCTHVYTYTYDKKVTGDNEQKSHIKVCTLCGKVDESTRANCADCETYIMETDSGYKMCCSVCGNILGEDDSECTHSNQAKDSGLNKTADDRCYYIYYKCDDCGTIIKKEKAQPSHVFGDATIEKATCMKEGKSSVTCTICGYTEESIITKTNHSFGDWMTAKTATCTEEGTKKRNCTVCGKEETETVSALGHKWDNGTVTTEAKCTSAGEKVYKCTNPGCTETKKEEIKATGHKYPTTPDKTENGYKIYKCTVCGNEQKLPAGDTVDSNEKNSNSNSNSNSSSGTGSSTQQHVHAGDSPVLAAAAGVVLLSGSLFSLLHKKKKEDEE